MSLAHVKLDFGKKKVILLVSYFGKFTFINSCLSVLFPIYKQHATKEKHGFGE